MPSPFDDALDDLHDAVKDTFGATITYDQTGTPAFDVTGVFDVDHEFVEVGQGQDGSNVSSVGPMAEVFQADLPAGFTPKQDDTLTIEGADYVVKEVIPDGRGGIKLELFEASP